MMLTHNHCITTLCCKIWCWWCTLILTLISLPLRTSCSFINVFNRLIWSTPLCRRPLKIGLVVFCVLLIVIKPHEKQQQQQWMYSTKYFFHSLIYHQWTTLLHWVVCSFSLNKPHTISYFQSIPKSLFCCHKYTLEHQIWINPPQKIVPDKCAISSCLSVIC